jgi:actin-like ATPase involved in cell morphogenesis
MSYLLGIDVGTTRTAAAICRPGGRAPESEMVSLGDRSSAVPSVLHVSDDGGILVGDAAERRAVPEPDRVVREFKRRIGDPTPIVVGGRPWAPEELSARLVRWVVERVAQREGGPAARIAVTHPASWGGHKKDRLGGALATQGLPVTFLAEPQAAALHYAAAERVEPGSTIAVYDFGGGTFDAALVHKEAHGFSLLGRPEGLERLGGIDFDEAIFEYVRTSLPEAFADLDEADPAVLSAIAAVRRECTEAKEALSSDTEVSISVLTPVGQGAVRLHRTEFEALIRPQVEDTVDALRRAIHSAGLSAPQLTAVLLVGGSSRVPLVAQLVSEQLGRPVAVDADPKNAIALGAALSLTPAGAGATGVGSARVPAPRPSPGRRDVYGGTTEVVATRAAAQPNEGKTQVYGTSARGFGPPGALGAAGVVGPPAQRGPAEGSIAPRAAARPSRPDLPYPERPMMSPDDVDDYEYDHAEPGSGRTPAMLVSIGGAAAAVLVIASVFLFHGKDPVTADEGRFAAAQSGPATSTTTSATPTESAEPVVETGKPTRSGKPPVVARPTTTVPPPTTAPPTTLPVPTTEPPAPTSKPPEPTKDPVPTSEPPADGGDPGTNAALN